VSGKHRRRCHSILEIRCRGATKESQKLVRAREARVLAHVLHYEPIGHAIRLSCWPKGPSATVLPRTVICQDCGQIASVRGYGRIEYDWPKTTASGPKTTTPTLTCVRLTVDCPLCGVKSQEFFPEESSSAAPQTTTSATGREATGREVRLRKTGPTIQRHFGLR
jgi:hypothetical protein